MRYVEWLPTVYEIALRCNSSAKGRSNIYLVLLDYQDRDGRYGVYVGMSKYSPAQRFDQHKRHSRGGQRTEERHRSADRADAAFAVYQALGGRSYRGGVGVGLASAGYWSRWPLNDSRVAIDDLLGGQRALDSHTYV